MLCQMHDINSMSNGDALAPNSRNSLPVRTFRQRSCNQRVGYLLCSVAGFYRLDRSYDMCTQGAIYRKELPSKKLPIIKMQTANFPSEIVVPNCITYKYAEFEIDRT